MEINTRKKPNICQIEVKNEDKMDHGTTERTEIRCKKIPCHMRGSACRWFVVKKAKIL